MKLLCRIVTSAAAASVLLTTSAIAEELAKPEREIKLDDVGGGRLVVIPKWDNGFFVRFEIPDGGTTPAVYLQDADGKDLTKAVVSMPDAVENALSDVAVSPQGELAVAGGASWPGGRGTGYILFLDKTGKALQLLRTAPFSPLRICFGADGTVWAIGWELDASGMELAEYNILRHYGRDGKVIHSAIPRSLFSLPGHLGPVSQSYLTASGDRIGIYSDRTREWIEVSATTGALVRRWAGPDLGPKSRVVGAFLTNSGFAYVSAENRDTQVRTALKLDRYTGTWADVKNISHRIVGTDGESVLELFAHSQIRWVMPDH